MISIIVCSRNKSLSDRFVRNIDDTIGVEYELVCIDNSSHQYSIFSAYNEGVERSTYPFLCFVHEDVLFHSQGWGEKIIAHLRRPQVGIIGLAGSDFVSRQPGANLVFQSCINIIQSDKSGTKATQRFHFPENIKQSSYPVVSLDGVFLSMRRDLMTKIKFDECFSGFHAYDIDISIQATVAGYTNFVVSDIDVEHFSWGTTDANYYRNRIAVFKKWNQVLPLCGLEVFDDQRKMISAIDERGFYRLQKKMIRLGFLGSEIVNESNYFGSLIDSSKANRSLRFLKWRIFLIRLFSCPRYLLK